MRAGMRFLAAMSVAALMLSGCSSSPDAEPEPTDEATSESSANDVDKSFKMLADLEVTGSGVAAFSWQGREEVQITRVGNPSIDTNLLSAGFLVPVKTDDPQNRFRWAFDLLNAYADEPGTFTIDANPVNEQGLKSLAFLIWLRATEANKDKDALQDMSEVEFLKEFRTILKPCTIVIGEGILSGSIDCPELATEDGEVAGMKVAWSNGEKLSEEDDAAES